MKRKRKPVAMPAQNGRHARPFCLANQPRALTVTARDDEAELVIYNEIGAFGVSARMIRRELDAISAKRLKVRINSPGGDVFDGIAIYNDLVQHDAEVTVVVTGLAASAASVIAMAGDRIEVAKSGFLMIHNAWTIALGNKADMRQTADVLEQIDGALAQIYAERTGGEAKAIAKLMDAETWLSGDEALERGFADAVIEPERDDKAKALFDLSLFANVPAQLKRDIESGLRDAGYSLKEAKAALSEGFGVLSPRDADGAGPTPRDADAEGLAALTELRKRLIALS